MVYNGIHHFIAPLLAHQVKVYNDASHPSRYAVSVGYTTSKPGGFDPKLTSSGVTSLFKKLWVTPLLYSALDLWVEKSRQVPSHLRCATVLNKRSAAQINKYIYIYDKVKEDFKY